MSKQDLVETARALVAGHAGCLSATAFARAIQQPALEIWGGQERTVLAAQDVLRHRAKCNQAARRGEYDSNVERSAS